MLATHPRVKVLLLTNPSNPTGATYTAAEMQALADVLKETSVLVISDEIYSELQYEGEHASMATYLPQQTIVVNGVSKSHAMTGYRIGILAGPAALIAQINKVHGFVIMTPSNPAMAAATEAFNCERSLADTQRMKAAYQARRDFLVTELTALGFEMVRPNGAFYIFAKIPVDLGQDDVAFANELVAQERLAVVAGSGFGPGGEGYIRISYAASMDMLVDAMSRLKSFATSARATAV